MATEEKGKAMNHPIGSALLAGMMAFVLLTGCTATSAPTSESTSQPVAQAVVGEAENSSSSSADEAANPPASSADIPPQTTEEPKPEQTQREPIVYAEGRIADNGDALFEVPGELDADHFRSFALNLTIAIKSPLDSIENVDSETAFRLSRCMLECFYRTYPDICDQVVYRETHDGVIRNYTVIPVADFLDFTTTHLGLDTLDFFKNATPADDNVVRFDLEEDQILFVPSMERVASDFESGHVEIEDNIMRLYASSESKGERVYLFDISNGMEQYRLVRVD